MQDRTPIEPRATARRRGPSSGCRRRSARSTPGRRRWSRDLWLPLSWVVLLACQPEIGDSCSNASDCSVQDPRTCDTTFPGGYCTVFGCGAETCPQESACIGFQSVVSLAPACASAQSRPRLQRTACMRRCGSDQDCRNGYECIDMSAENPWAATVVDRGRGVRVCSLPPPEPPTGDPAVCDQAPPGAPALPDAGEAARDAALPDAAL